MSDQGNQQINGREPVRPPIDPLDHLPSDNPTMNNQAPVQGNIDTAEVQRNNDDDVVQQVPPMARLDQDVVSEQNQAQSGPGYDGTTTPYSNQDWSQSDNASNGLDDDSDNQLVIRQPDGSMVDEYSASEGHQTQSADVNDGYPLNEDFQTTSNFRANDLHDINYTHGFSGAQTPLSYPQSESQNRLHASLGPPQQTTPNTSYGMQPPASMHNPGLQGSWYGTSSYNNTPMAPPPVPQGPNHNDYMASMADFNAGVNNRFVDPFGSFNQRPQYVQQALHVQQPHYVQQHRYLQYPQQPQQPQYGMVGHNAQMVYRPQQSTLNHANASPAQMSRTTTTQVATTQTAAAESVQKTPRARKSSKTAPTSRSSQKTATTITGNNKKTPLKRGKNQETPSDMGSSGKRKRDPNSGATGSDDTDEEPVDLTREEEDQALKDAKEKKKQASAKKAAETKARVKRQEEESMQKLEAQRLAIAEQRNMLERMQSAQEVQAEVGMRRFGADPDFQTWLNDVLRPVRDSVPVAIQAPVQANADVEADLLMRLRQIRKRNNRKEDQE